MEFLNLLLKINFNSNKEENPTKYKHNKTEYKANLLSVSKYKIDNGIHNDEKNNIEIYKEITILKSLNCKLLSFFTNKKYVLKIIYPKAPRIIDIKINGIWSGFTSPHNKSGSLK